MPASAEIQDSARPVLARARNAFQQLYGTPAAYIFRAPGRVNLIGEHTDYNDGFVMPAAIGFYTYTAAGPRNDRKLCVYSMNFHEEASLELDAIDPGSKKHWSDYVRGVAGVLQQTGTPLRGTNLVIHGEVPIGSGLSSSAAIEVSSALALLANAGVEMERGRIAQVCQQAEHKYAGAFCGIMDQFVSCFGEANHAMLLDCRSLAREAIPIAADVRIVICNTKVKHDNASGEYNARRRSCEDGVRHLQQFLPAISALRDVTMADLKQHGGNLPEITHRRCRHVITENLRVQAAGTALKNGDLAGFGKLMADSHTSLRRDYEVTCNELDLMVDLASDLPGLYGARMTGGGFGGCTVNLVQAQNVDEFHAKITEGYQRAIGIVPEIYVCSAAQGAGLCA
jgi:galactokinase